MPATSEHEPIGPRIRRMRLAKEWSLTELADQAGISRSYLAQVEKGDSIPTHGKIVQLANALGSLPSELYGEDLQYDNIPESLRRFAEQEDLGSADVQTLARIEYRGRRPETPEEWKVIYAVIKGILEQ